MKVITIAQLRSIKSSIDQMYSAVDSFGRTSRNLVQHCTPPHSFCAQVGPLLTASEFSLDCVNRLDQILELLGSFQIGVYCLKLFTRPGYGKKRDLKTPLINSYVLKICYGYFWQKAEKEKASESVSEKKARRLFRAQVRDREKGEKAFSSASARP